MYVVTKANQEILAPHLCVGMDTREAKEEQSKRRGTFIDMHASVHKYMISIQIHIHFYDIMDVHMHTEKARTKQQSNSQCAVVALPDEVIV